MSAILKLRYQDNSAPRDPFELVFHHHVRITHVCAHWHDFAELSWIQAGTCWHVVNGVEAQLRPGDLLYLRPDDCHEFMLPRGKPLKIVNLAFPAAALTTLVRRYDLDSDLFWGYSPLPERLRHLPVDVALQVDRQFLDLHAGPHTQLALDLFLMTLLHQLRSLDKDPLAGCPPWLSETCRLMQQPDHFRNGPREFERLAKRSLAHISRVLRHVTGRTPVAWVTEWRLRHAANRLAGSTQEISSIADECGFRSLGRFYQLFTKRFGMPPLRYRWQQRHVFPEGSSSFHDRQLSPVAEGSLPARRTQKIRRVSGGTPTHLLSL